MSDKQDSRDDSERTSEPSQPAGEGTPPAAELAGEPSSAEVRVAALEAEKAELKDRMLRIAAEFDNYKKRVRKDMSEHENKVREAILRDFLEIADNLERAVATAGSGTQKDIKSVQDGVELVLRLFRAKLERYAVTAFEAAGQPFDPRLHDAISQAPSAEATPGTVLHELQKGYRVGERLLRPAVVIVATAPPAASADKPAPQTDGKGVEIDVNGKDESDDVPVSPSKGDKPS